MSRMSLLAAIMVASTCATAQSPKLVAAGGVQRLAGASVELPNGWMRTGAGEELLATRDGYSLQVIRVESGKPASSGLLPEELAEKNAAFTSWKLREVHVTAVRPAKLGGRAGYRLELSSRDDDGLAYRSVVVGAVIGERQWLVSYRAPARHYFELDLATFERVVEMFTVDGGS